MKIVEGTRNMGGDRVIKNKIMGGDKSFCSSTPRGRRRKGRKISLDCRTCTSDEDYQLRGEGLSLIKEGRLPLPSGLRPAVGREFTKHTGSPAAENGGFGLGTGNDPVWWRTQRVKWGSFNKGSQSLVGLEAVV